MQHNLSCLDIYKVIPDQSKCKSKHFKSVKKCIYIDYSDKQINFKFKEHIHVVSLETYVYSQFVLQILVLSYYMSLRSEFLVVMSVTISA